MKNKILLLLISLLLTLQNAYSKPLDFVVNDERNNVSFTSDAPIELIVGRTPKIIGMITIDDSLDLNKIAPKVSFEVDLATIDTGIPLRNEHMRDNFLETKKFPKATFKVKQITAESPGKLTDGKLLKLIAKGDFTIHGVTVIKAIPIKVTYFKEGDLTHNRFEHGDVIRIQTTFEVPLGDHKIKKPEALLQKLTDTVIITIDAYGNASK